MPADLSTWVLLSLLGGWVAMDGTAAAQLMVSRPFVAATLAGWVVGSPVAGATAGLLLEALHLTVLPVGAARYPEGGPPAVAAGAAYAASGGGAATLLTVSVFFLVWEALAGYSVRHLRQVNGRLILSGGAGIQGEWQLERRHLAAVALDFLRGVVLVLGGLAALHLLLALVGHISPPQEAVSVTSVRLALVALLAGAAHLFGGRLRIVAAGAAAGLLLVLLRV